MNNEYTDNTYNDNGNIKCKKCGSKIEGGYCDCFIRRGK